MPKFLELQCCECETKKKFVDAKDVTFQKWRIVAWNVSTANPIVACDKCILPWEASKHTKNFGEDKKESEPIEIESTDPECSDGQKISKTRETKKVKSKKSNEKKRIQKRNKSTN